MRTATKHCPRCKTTKPAGEFNRLRRSRDGLGACCRECRTDEGLQRVHGITLEDYNRQLAEQDNRCAICRREWMPGQHRFHVDHNHETGERRGLLCYSCNIKLGWFEKFMPAVLRYLKIQS